MHSYNKHINTLQMQQSCRLYRHKDQEMKQN
uniref:Uncharacterized protein n=1 Tax=Arundo donax TaxID=35708 RepID=A0A0A9FGK1_ARUDO